MMSVVSLRLPASIHQHVRTIAAQEGISVTQFITLAVTEKIATLDTKHYLQERAKRGNREKLLAVLAKAPDIEPEEADLLPS